MADEPRSARKLFDAELDQLRLQVELVALRVDENLQEMRLVLATGDHEAARRALAADDAIDAAVVSLTERCHDVLIREAPVAADSRFVVAVLRVLLELERIGDLALRVVKLAPQQPLLAARPETFEVLLAMADAAIDLFRRALQAWSERNLELAGSLAVGSGDMEAYDARLTAGVLAFGGPDAVAQAVATVRAGQAIERIADHAVIIADRLRYLITADPRYLAREVAPNPGVWP